MINFVEVKSSLTKHQMREYKRQKYSLFADTGKAEYSVMEALRRASLV